MKDAVKAIKCENVANFTSGFEYAFEILHRVSVWLTIFRWKEENDLLVIKCKRKFSLYFINCMNAFDVDEEQFDFRAKRVINA